MLDAVRHPNRPLGLRPGVHLIQVLCVFEECVTGKEFPLGIASVGCS